MHGINWIDVSLVILVAACFIRGLFDGCIKQLSLLLGVVLGIFCSRMLFAIIHPRLTGIVSDIPDTVAVVLSYIVSFLIIYIAVRIMGKMTRKCADMVSLGWADSLLGGLFGALKILLLVGFVLHGIDWVDPESQHLIPSQTKQESWCYNRLKRSTLDLYRMGRDAIHPIYPANE